MVRLKDNGYIPSGRHKQHISTAWMTVKKFTNIVHLDWMKQKLAIMICTADEQTALERSTIGA